MCKITAKRFNRPSILVCGQAEKQIVRTLAQQAMKLIKYTD